MLTGAKINTENQAPKLCNLTENRNKMLSYRRETALQLAL